MPDNVLLTSQSPSIVGTEAPTGAWINETNVGLGAYIDITPNNLGSQQFVVDKSNFSIGNGDGTNYPANYESIKNPPRHPDCRCRIVPVVVGLKEYNKIIKLKKQDQAQEAKDIEIKKLQNELDEKEKEQGKQFSKVNKELKDIKEMNEKELGKIAEDVKDLLNE